MTMPFTCVITINPHCCHVIIFIPLISLVSQLSNKKKNKKNLHAIKQNLLNRVKISTQHLVTVGG
jgi:hypothetical protein